MYRSLSIACVCGALPPIAQAQSIPSPFLIGGEYQLEADTDEGGSFSRAVAQSRVSAPLWLGEDSLLAVSVGYQFESFNFDGFADDPWSDLNRTKIALVAKQDLTSSWSWIALAFVEADNENGADFNESITGGAVGLALYRFSDTLKFGLGLRVSGNLEDDVSIIPIPIIDWDFAENWTFTTTPPDGFSVGPGVSVRWEGLDDLSLSLVYQYQSDSHRLADSAPTGFENRINGVGEFRQSRVAVVATYHFTEHLSLTGHAGLTFGGEIELNDDEGETLEKNDFDSSLVFGFEGSWNF